MAACSNITNKSKFRSNRNTNKKNKCMLLFLIFPVVIYRINEKGFLNYKIFKIRVLSDRVVRFDTIK